MKKLTAILLALALVLSLSFTAFAAATQNGNGCPSGSHYNLNIIGVDKDKSASMDNANGHVIFVPTYGKTRILLSQGEDFRVLDANGTNEEFTRTVLDPFGNEITDSADGTARFQMPTDLYNADGTCKYNVFVRVLGSPKKASSATIQPGYYFTDANGQTWLYMSTVILPLSRKSGAPKFEDVTKQLMYVTYYTGEYDAQGNPITATVPLFADANGNGQKDEQYFWDYDNAGLKLAQIRFYPAQ